jgi:hypothetical protein
MRFAMCNKTLRAHEVERISRKEKVNQQERNANTKVKHKYITQFTLFCPSLDPSSSVVCLILTLFQLSDASEMRSKYKLFTNQTPKLSLDTQTQLGRPFFYLPSTNHSQHHVKVYAQNPLSRRDIQLVSSIFLLEQLSNPRDLSNFRTSRQHVSFRRR